MSCLWDMSLLSRLILLSRFFIRFDSTSSWNQMVSQSDCFLFTYVSCSLLSNSSMKLLYPDYKFELILIIVGALGSISVCLLQGIECLGFTGKESNRIINILQQKSIIGTISIWKTFLGFALWMRVFVSHSHVTSIIVSH